MWDVGANLGHYTALLLVLGALSVVLVCWLSWRAGLVDYEHRELEGSEVGTRFGQDSWEARLAWIRDSTDDPLAPTQGSRFLVAGEYDDRRRELAGDRGGDRLRSRGTVNPMRPISEFGNPNAAA